jgi:hypothetical protein
VVRESYVVSADFEVARAAGELARVADADEARELPNVLRHFPYREALDFYEYAVIAAGVAGDEGARETRLAMRTLLLELRDVASERPPSDAGGPP